MPPAATLFADSESKLLKINPNLRGLGAFETQRRHIDPDRHNGDRVLVLGRDILDHTFRHHDTRRHPRLYLVAGKRDEHQVPDIAVLPIRLREGVRIRPIEEKAVDRRQPLRYLEIFDPEQDNLRILGGQSLDDRRLGPRVSRLVSGSLISTFGLSSRGASMVTAPAASTPTPVTDDTRSAGGSTLS